MVNSDLHWSELKVLSKSPAHYLENLRAGRDGESTPAQRFGLAVHALVLGGEIELYEGERKGNRWASFKDAHKGKLIVTAPEYERARLAADAVRNDGVAGPLLSGTMTEQAWQAAIYGRPCGGRIDAFKPGALIDLKTSTTTDPRPFSYACRRMAYPAQLAWYREALRSAGQRVDDAWIVGVEVKAPFAVTVLRVTPRALELGERQNRAWVERLNACEQADEWPAYTQTAVDLDVEEEGFGITIDGETVGFGDEEAA